ncbi:sugar transferase [Hyphomonas johnsonii]|uniref:Sugar transferase n=1 Tax=Hyphomonas johnsonii MHS-2 TaxID=1280950 RepID=A0A059FUY3_9PROT|nr:sugar transferase [Hyphomonas johnsonii]KCZ94490.1 sugar transferase [Hyphomonas johnsonii MHS-2]
MGLRLSNESRQAEATAYSAAHAKASLKHDNAQIKRLFDIVVSGTALLFVAPLLLVLAIMIRMQDGGAAFFSQRRYGLNGETFNCFKLRSMVIDSRERLEHLLANDPEALREWEETQKLTNDPRITPLGQFIRKTSIDELPQLYNVLRGDMSLVGPRPIVENEILRYGDSFRHYCAVRPGITGLWQVSGRSDVSYPERVATDIEYVRTRSFWGDNKIVFQTIPAVLLSRGAR